MADKVEVKIVGDESSAQAAMRRAAQAVEDAAQTMRTKMGEIRSSSRAALGGMGQDAKEGSADVKSSMSGIASTLEKVNANFKAFVGGFKEGWREADAEIKKAHHSAEQMRDELGRFKGASSGGAGGGLSMAMEVFKGGAMLEGARKLKDLAVGAVETSAEFERLRSVLLTLEGSQSAANGRFAQLQKFAQETPFELTEVVEAFSKLKAQGLDPSNAALKAYGNTAAGMGKTLDQMVEAVGDAAMGEFERLKEFGIKTVDAGDHVVMNFKGHATSIKKNSADIQAYLQQIGNVDFAGSMENQMNTLGGKFSNLSDGAAAFADQVGQGGLSDAIKEAADEMLGANANSTELAHGIGAVLGEAVRGIVDIIKTMASVFQQSFEFVKQIVADTMGKSAADTVTLGNYLKLLQSVVAGFAAAVRSAFVIVYAAVQTGINQFVTFSQVVDAALHLDLSGMTNAVEQGVQRQVSIVRNGINQIKGIVADGKARFGEIWNPKAGTTPATTTPPPTSSIPGTNFGKAAGGGAGGGKKTKVGGAGPSEMDKWRTDLQDQVLEEEKAGRDTLAFVASFWQKKLALTKAGTKEQLEVRRELSRAQISLNRAESAEETAQIKQDLQLKQEAAKTEAELARVGLEEKLQAIQEKAQMGLISGKQEVEQRAEVNRQLYQLDVDLEQQLYTNHLNALRAEQRLNAQGTREYRENARQIELLEAQHNQRLAILNRNYRRSEAQEERQAMAQRRQQLLQLSNTWGQNIARMLTLQQGFMATVRGLWQGLVDIVAGVLQKIIAQWIMAQLIKIGLLAGEHKATVASEASMAGAGGVASMAAAPFPLNLGAPAFGASMYAAAMAFGAMNFSAKDGYDVPNLAGPGVDGRGGQIGVVHPREMILPQELADQVRKGAGGGGGGGLHLHGQIITSPREIERWFKQNRKGVGAAAKDYVRQGGRM